jgi:hypothetical protein
LHSPHYLVRAAARERPLYTELLCLSKLTFPITLIRYWIRLYKEAILYVSIKHIIKEEIKTLTFEALHYPVFPAIALLCLYFIANP